MDTLISNKELKALLELCNKYGVKRVKTAQVELELETIQSPTLDSPDAGKGPLNANGDVLGGYTDEQILAWSSEGNG